LLIYNSFPLAQPPRTALHQLLGDITEDSSIIIHNALLEALARRSFNM